MMIGNKVKRYEATDYDLVLEFMKKVTALEVVDPQIIEQAILITECDKVIGMVSFESFNQVGMVRYFIYEQYIAPDLLVNMFFELYHAAKEKELNQLVAVAPHPYACQLFNLLGFVEIPKNTQLAIPNLLKSEDVQLMSIKF